MRIEQFSIFLEVAKCQNISTAAEKLYMQPTTISHSIKALEKDLNMELFIRKANSISLSPKGEAILPIVKQINASIELLNNISKSNFLKKEDLFLALTPQTIKIFGNAIYSPLKALFPDSNIHVLEKSSPVMIDFISQGKADLAFSFCGEQSVYYKKQLSSNLHLNFETLFHTTQMIICNPDNVLAKETVIYKENIKNNKMLLLDGFIKDKTNISSVVKENLSFFQNVDTFPNYEAIISILKTDKTALSIIPEAVLKYDSAVTDGYITSIPLLSKASSSLVAYIVYRDTSNDPLLQACVELLRKFDF